MSVGRDRLALPPRRSRSTRARASAALVGCALAWAGRSPAQEPSATPAAPPADPARRRALEAELAAALEADEPPAPASAPRLPSLGPLRLLDLSFDLVGAAGGSTASEADLRSLKAGGHDPKNHGFTVQNVELTFAGVVDPYLRGDANIVLLIDAEGETVIELEEAYLSSLDLPWNLEIEAGQFFTEFGRLNPTHPHSWDFVDQPVVSSRFFGPDGLRSPGVQLSWLAPLPFFTELVVSAQNAQGETVTSFRNVPGETVAGRTAIERDVRGLEDLLYLARLRSSFDPTDELAVVGGVSALFGPNASAADTRTRVHGVDLYAKWRPLANDHGWPFLAWQTEAMLRRYEAGQVLGGSGGAVEAATTLDDVGLYSQLLWGFARPWVAGIRYEIAEGEAAQFESADGAYDTRLDALRDGRQRYSAVVSHYPSEFSKLRLQYDFDHSEHMSDDAHSVFLQFEILFGAHGAHTF